MSRCSCCNRQYDATHTEFGDWCPACVEHDQTLYGSGRAVNSDGDTVDACPHYEYPDEDSWTLTGVR